MTPPSLTGLSEAQRERALERFQIVRPFLEEGIPLARVARDRGIILRTLQRWVGQLPSRGARRARSQGAKRPRQETALRQPPSGHRRTRPEETAPVRGVHPSPDRHPRRAARGSPAELQHRLCRDPRARPGPGDPGPRRDEGLRRRLRPGPSPRGDRSQRRLAGRSYGTGHLAERRAWAAREALADHHPRRLQPCRGRLRAVLRQPLGDPDGPGPAAGDLAQGPTGLAGLRHPRRSSIPTTAATSRPGTSNRWPPTSRSA